MTYNDNGYHYIQELVKQVMTQYWVTAHKIDFLPENNKYHLQCYAVHSFMLLVSQFGLGVKLG